MGFYDDPIVDSSSKISEESVLATKLAFLQKNGFLVREENPDKGVDFDVELIIDDRVSGFKFAIQIKSAQKLQQLDIKGESYISYHIKTSRLGYLCRRSPGFGLIVVYDERNRHLYYDYVENIYRRIVAEHGDDEWKQNETVTFHIDAKSIVDGASIKSIYEKMKQKRANFIDLYEKNASDFDLPTFDDNEYKNPVVILEKYGYVLLNKKEYQIIYSMLSEMHLSKILGNRKLLLLSAITYYHIGQYVEGDYFLKKCDQYLNDYDDEEKELLLISKLTSDFSLGKISRKIYYEKLKELEPTIKGSLNSIYMCLQILFIDLLSKSIYEETSWKSVFDNLKSIEAKVNSLDVADDMRYAYMLEIASLIHEIGMRQFIELTARTMVQKKSLGLAPIKERISNAQQINLLILKPRELLQLIWDYSERTKNTYLQAMVLFKRTYMFYGLTLNSFMASYCDRDQDDIAIYKTQYPSNLFDITYADILNAYNIFKSRRDLSQAYKCLSISEEINYLFRFIYGKNINDDLYNKASHALRNLEKELNLETYSLLTEKVIIDATARKKEHKDLADNYDSLTDEKKHQIANLFIKSNGLPADRISNIISEMNFMKNAREAVDSKYYDILQNLEHTKSRYTCYKEPPRYVIRCKKCKYQTVESGDLNILLSCLRTEHGHICL